MLRTFPVGLVFFFAGIIFTNTAIAQASADSTANGRPLYANIEADFNTAIGAQSRLYNGERYEFYNPAIKGNGYLFDNDKWSKGNILYDGFWYRNVDMLYDLYKDEVIVPVYKSFLKFSLINEKVASFDLLQHHFIYINATAATGPVHPGYYDVLYNGKIQLLCRRSKNIQEVHNFNGTIDSYFLSSYDYYLYKNGGYSTVNSKGAFLDNFKDKKREVQQFIRDNKLKIKKEFKEQAMVKIADYYDHLTK